MISPKMVMIDVETIKPVIPDVRSPIKIARAELTVTFPSKMVHRSKLPLLLRGRIFLAYSASLASYSLLKGPLVRSSRFLTSSPRSPRLRPEKHPEREARITIKTMFKGSILTSSSNGPIISSGAPSGSV